MEVLSRAIDWVLHSNQRARESYGENLLTLPPEELRGREHFLQRRVWSDTYWAVADGIMAITAVSFTILLAVNGRNPVDGVAPVATTLLLAVSAELQRRGNNQRLVSVREVTQQLGLQQD